MLISEFEFVFSNFDFWSWQEGVKGRKMPPWRQIFDVNFALRGSKRGNSKKPNKNCFPNFLEGYPTPFSFKLHIFSRKKHQKWLSGKSITGSQGFSCTMFVKKFQLRIYLTGYKDISLDDLKKFRQVGSPTAGHPEYGEILRVLWTFSVKAGFCFYLKVHVI